MACLNLPPLFDIPKKESASDSIILFFERDGVHVVMKMTTQPSTCDNSLQVERDIYTKIATTLAFYSPHLLASLSTGSCDDSVLLNMKDSANHQEAELCRQWMELRANAIAIQEHFNGQAMPKNISADEMLRSPKWRTKFNQIHFVMTPHMKGEALTTFLERDDLPENILATILVQIAQVLTVLAAHRVMHNDLHLGNIFVETLAKPKHIRYYFPKKATLYTRYVVTVFDFDRGSAPGLTNKLLNTMPYCVALGQCNTYVAKLDWYNVLSRLAYSGGEHDIPHAEEVRALLGTLYESPFALMFGNTVGQNAAFGFPCTCTHAKTNGEGCTTCTARSLEKLSSPRDYFMRHI